MDRNSSTSNTINKWINEKQGFRSGMEEERWQAYGLKLCVGFDILQVMATHPLGFVYPKHQYVSYSSRVDEIE